ncbi:MAG: AAA family ATPase [Anaerolineales bacterium]|nr:AAA family ATPase [Anaerolineales bacterium]
MTVLHEGPFVDLSFIKNAASIPNMSNLEGMGDVMTIGFLSVIMHDARVRSAVVIVQAETTLCRFEDPRMLSGLIGEWTRLSSENRNRCFFLITANDRQQLLEAAERLPIPELRASISHGFDPRRGQSLFQIRGPEILEMNRLILAVKQQTDLDVDMDQLEKLSTWMAEEGINAREWIGRLQGVRRLDLDALRSQGWISAFRDRHSSAQQQLEALIGLEEIKERILEMTAWLSLKQHKKESLDHHPTMHMVFTGNPGTGKTSVARLLGEILHEIGFLRRGHLVEARGSDLVADYVGGTAIKTNQVIDSALDGILFIDEAYVLSEKDRGGYGQEAIDSLLVRLENDRQRLVVIIAGYPSRIEKFLSTNPGLRRRFPKDNRFHFPDFSPLELYQILTRMCREKGLAFPVEVEDSLKEITRHLIRHKDLSFGNAGEIRNLVESIDRRRAFRISRMQLALDAPVILDDLPDDYRKKKTAEVSELKSIIQELDQLVGLREVKSYLKTLAHTISYERLRQQRDPQYQSSSLLTHMAFLGNPGTGKTSVARLIGRIYHSLGLLRKGHCIEVSRVDLVAEFVGQTATKTQEKILEALDGILFIDEAYSLARGSDSDYGQEAIDTLVKMMEDYRERLVVIVAGYPERMMQFMSSNPGLSSRFDQPIVFQDFSIPELQEILCRKAATEGYLLSKDVVASAGRVLEDLKRREATHFGNARAVVQLFNQMKSALATRVIRSKNEHAQEPTDEEMITIVRQDVPGIPLSPPAYPHLSRQAIEASGNLGNQAKKEIYRLK